MVVIGLHHKLKQDKKELDISERILYSNMAYVRFSFIL